MSEREEMLGQIRTLISRDEMIDLDYTKISKITLSHRKNVFSPINIVCKDNGIYVEEAKSGGRGFQRFGAHQMSPPITGPLDKDSAIVEVRRRLSAWR